MCAFDAEQPGTQPEWRLHAGYEWLLEAPPPSFHPPGFAGAAHGMEARRSMTTCASCHSERDCVACHGATSIGAGLSPHPPGFAAGCASALERNPRACITCHGDAAGLAARCR